MIVDICSPDDDDKSKIDRIVLSATQKLRETYFPSKQPSGKNTKTERHVLIARKAHEILGVIEYRITGEEVYFQGLAVDQNFCMQGVARSLVNHIELLAVKGGCKSVTLATIEETGNVEIFTKLVFSVTKRKETVNFISSKFETLHIVNMAKFVA